MKDRLKAIAQIIESETGKNIKSKERDTSHVFARSIYYKVARELDNSNGGPFSYSSIGKTVNRDHATVLYNLRRVFPQAVKLQPYRSLYDKLHVLVKENHWRDLNALSASYNSVSEMDEELKRLFEENNRLRVKLQRNPLLEITNDLSDEELDEVADKLKIMVKAIKSRVYN